MSDRPYGHFPTIESLVELRDHLSKVTPKDDEHAADLAEDIAALEAEITLRSN